jgi:hypothetical protein
MNNRRGTTVKNIHVLAAVAALVATPAAFASAADAPFVVPGTRYQLVDERGNVVGELVTETGTRLRLRPIGATGAMRAAQRPALPATSDRTFHPDYRNALSAGQMSAAWQAAWDRINPPLVTGGG